MTLGAGISEVPGAIMVPPKGRRAYRLGCLLNFKGNIFAYTVLLLPPVKFLAVEVGVLTCHRRPGMPGSLPAGSLGF